MSLTPPLPSPPGSRSPRPVGPEATTAKHPARSVLRVATPPTGSRPGTPRRPTPVPISPPQSKLALLFSGPGRWPFGMFAGAGLVLLPLTAILILWHAGPETLHIGPAGLARLRAELPLARQSQKQSIADDEILYREALRVGLDRDDLVVRRRLIQRMNALLEEAGLAEQPSEAVLRGFYEAHIERYQPSSFEQVRGRVVDDILGERRELAHATGLEALRRRYSVEFDD